MRLALNFILCASLTLAGCSGDVDKRVLTHKPRSIPPGGRNVGWSMYNGGYAGQRHADLDVISRDNAHSLAPVCSTVVGETGSFQTGPLVYGDTVFITTAHATLALDATTCAIIWRSTHASKRADVNPVNRGAAILDGRLFRGTPDGRLLALDAGTGRLIWEDSIGNSAVGEFVSSAPIAWNGTVFVGLAGGDWGIRGHVMAFDAVNGRERWRFYTIPMGSEVGADSWQIPETAKRGGGAQWTSYALDTAANELFVPVGNPAPDFAPQWRPGANLFTNSLVVLDTRTGRLKWYYQFSPADGFDYDLAAPPMLYETGSVARVALASKDGNVYSVDRATHRLIFKSAVTTIENHGAAPTAAGVLACPGSLGGVEWNGPAFDPGSQTLYVGAVDWCSIFYASADTPSYKPGEGHTGTSYAPAAGAKSTGWLTAIDARSGATRWRFHAPQPIVAGVTSTSGHVIFNGDLAGNFYAFDAANGKVLYTYKTAGAIAGGIITYMVRGEQYVAVTSGNVSRTAFQGTGVPTLTIFAIDGDSGSP
jgi:alcohol dehydrogenase (cytochrome c)